MSGLQHEPILAAREPRMWGIRSPERDTAPVCRLERTGVSRSVAMKSTDHKTEPVHRR